jgi:hypothetical protein
LLPVDNATWDFGTDLAPGTYVVSATWVPNAANPSDAAYEVQIGSPSFAFSADQQQAPGSFVEAGIAWQRLGQVQIAGNQAVRVSLNGLGVADAIRLDLASEIAGWHGLLPADGGHDIFLTTSAGPGAGAVEVFENVRIENTGSGDLELGPVQVTGLGFELATPPGATRLPPGGSTMFQFKFTAEPSGSASSRTIRPSPAAFAWRAEM